MKYASSTKLNKNQIMVELRLVLGQYFKQVICYLPLTYILSLLPVISWCLGDLTLGTRHLMSSRAILSTTKSKFTNMVPDVGMDPNVTSS